MRLQVYAYSTTMRSGDQDFKTSGAAMTPSVLVDWTGHRNAPSRVRVVRAGPWPSGLYFLRATATDGRVGYAPFIGCAYDGRLTRADRITVSEPVGWTYVVLGKHHLDWSALQSDASARDRNLVSIVIPVHGQPELTAACLASLYEIEAGCPFELVLVDNGSDPTTSALLDRCVSTHPNARLVRN